MLGGLQPIIIFQFSRLAPTLSDEIAAIPLVSQIPTVIDQPPIPIYLDDDLTGLFINSEDKNVDIKTETETLTDGSAPEVNQSGIGSGISINLEAKKDSLGLALIAAMIDQVFDKVTSKEYAITYLHGGITIFRGVLHNFSMNQNATNELMNIKLELSRGTKNPVKAPDVPVVGKAVGALPL